ncbi:MAG: AAA family ATPase [Bilifractor sp.]|jgi:MinD-like ATPase involved in chromosome partitioning or flagellar assembly
MEGKKPQLIIIDTDSGFLKHCEEDIIRRYSVNAEVQVITDPGFVDAYFSTEQNPDLMLIDEGSYGDGSQFAGHSIGRIYLLVPEAGMTKTYPDNVTVLMEFLPKEELFEKIDMALWAGVEVEDAASAEKEPAAPKQTKVVAVYSPIGGCGKSLVCVALARKLKMLDQKVLLIGCDDTQSLSVYLPGESYASPELAEKLIHPDEDTYWTILQNIKTDVVSYLLPFEKSLGTMNVGLKEFDVLIRTLVEKQDFDFIVLDIGSCLSREMTERLNKLKALILLTEANVLANRKMQKLLKNSELLPKCQCMIVANEYQSDDTRILRDKVFGIISPYSSWEKALEDPVFYRLALALEEGV